MPILNIWSLIAAFSFGAYFYRMANALHQNKMSWAVSGVLAFFVGESIWVLLFNWFLSNLCLRLFPRWWYTSRCSFTSIFSAPLPPDASSRCGSAIC